MTTIPPPDPPSGAPPPDQDPPSGDRSGICATEVRLQPTLLLTRPRAAAQGFLRALGSWPGSVILSPVLEIVEVRGPAPGIAAKSLIFTSKNAVRFYGGGTDLPAFCVGSATTAAARERGFDAREVGPDAASLLSALPALQPPVPLVHVRGAHVARPVAALLTAAGLRCEERVVYDQVAQELSAEARAALAAPAPVILPIFSPRSAEILGGHLKEIAQLGPRICVAISPAVAERIVDLVPGTRVFTAPAPDAAGMVKAVRASARHAHVLEGKPPLP